MAKVYDPILCMMVEEKVNTKDASRGHEIVVKTQNYLNSIGKNNSVGKYDRIVHGVKSLLEQGFLEGPELERAIKQEADRLLKKYNLDECPESMKDASPIPVVKVIETKGKYSIIQDDRGLYWVTVDKTGHGGGTAEVNLSNARRTLEHYILMDKLEAKYGKKEGYKRYLAGETDACPEGMTCDAEAYSVSYRKGNGPYQSIGVMANSESEAIEKFKKHLASKKQEAEIFGARIGESLETMKKKGKPVLDNRTIDEAIRMCDKDVSFPSEKEAIEYCKENGIDPHKIKTIGDKYVVSE